MDPSQEEAEAFRDLSMNHSLEQKDWGCQLLTLLFERSPQKMRKPLMIGWVKKACSDCGEEALMDCSLTRTVI